MGTLGRIVVGSLIVLPLSAQLPTQPQRPPAPQSTAPRPVMAKPALPVPAKAETSDPERIDKRRERMKDRDHEIDRMMKDKTKQQH